MSAEGQSCDFTLPPRCLEQLREIWNGLKANPTLNADDLYALLLPVLVTMATERDFTLPPRCLEQLREICNYLEAHPPKSAYEFWERVEPVLMAERQSGGFTLSRRCLEQFRGIWNGLKANPTQNADDLYALLLPVLKTMATERDFTLPPRCLEQLRETCKRLQANPPKDDWEFRERLEPILEMATERWRRTPGFGCLEQLREICNYLEANPADSADDFYALFLPVFDTALNKLIEWSEADDCSPLRDCASNELVDRLMSLTAQADKLMATNASTMARSAEFGSGDRRRARHPESPISLLAGDYLRQLVSLAARARTWRSVIHNDRQKLRPVILTEKGRWIARVERLPTFNNNTWEQWAGVVYEKMLAEQDFVKVRRALEKMGGKKRLCKFKLAIFKAVKSLSSKPTGMISGITRPV